MQSITNQLPDKFNNLKRVTKSYILVANALVWIDVLVGQFVNKINNKFRIRQKCDKLIDSKEKILTKGKEQIFKPIKEIDTPKEFKDITNKITSKEVQVPKKLMKLMKIRGFQ